MMSNRSKWRPGDPCPSCGSGDIYEVGGFKDLTCAECYARWNKRGEYVRYPEPKGKRRKDWERKFAKENPDSARP